MAIVVAGHFAASLKNKNEAKGTKRSCLIRAFVASVSREAVHMMGRQEKTMALRVQEQRVTGIAQGDVVLGMRISKRNVGTMLRIKKDSNVRPRGMINTSRTASTNPVIWAVLLVALVAPSTAR